MSLCRKERASQFLHCSSIKSEWSISFLDDLNGKLSYLKNSFNIEHVVDDG